jgi:hypothetical protein
MRFLKRSTNWLGEFSLLWQRLVLLSVVGWLWFAAIPVGLAQNLPNPQPEAAIEQPTFNGLSASDISSEKVSQFIQAYLQVLELIERREGDLQAAETESESLQIQREIETAAFAAIETAGLTSQEYLQLLGVANTDPDFGERIAIQLQEAMN